MRTHISVLGWLHIVLSGIYLVLALIIFFGFGVGSAAAVATGGHQALGPAALIASFGTFFAIFFMVLGLPGVLIGWGIVKQANWARVGGIILSILTILNLASFPVGTAIGVYGLWVLLNPETQAIFEGRQVASY